VIAIRRRRPIRSGGNGGFRDHRGGSEPECGIKFP
jgi:hypothetical protein